MLTLADLLLALCLDGDLVDRTNFPLHQLQRTLDCVAEQIHNGKGFCILRGLEADRYCLEDSMIVFLGVQSYVAERRMRQDEVGNMLGMTIPGLMGGLL